MADKPEPAPPIQFTDKESLTEIADEVDAKAEIVYDPTATRKKAREMMLAQGIRPEDNLFSRDIIRAKYGNEEDEESGMDREHMAATSIVQPAERQALIELAKEVNAKAGIVHDPTITGDKVQEMMRAAGIRPEDNILSHDIICAKQPDEGDEEPSMATKQASVAPFQPVDRHTLMELAKEINAKAGIAYDPTATRKKAREMLLAQGIRPEDNLFSRDIIRTKYPDDCEDLE